MGPFFELCHNQGFGEKPTDLERYFMEPKILEYSDQLTSKLKGNNHAILPETNSSHLEMDGWNMIVSFWGVGWPIL